MKNLTLIALTFLALNTFAGVFRVNPYQTITQDREVTLNFWPVNDAAVDIKVTKKKNGFANFEIKKFQASSSELQKISLGTIACNETLSYEIFLDKFKYDQVDLPALKCVEENKSMNIGFLSDTQIKNESGLERAIKLSELVEKIHKDNPFEVLVNAGDIVQVGANITEWLQFFDVSKTYLPKTYNIAAAGNHDYYDTNTTNKTPDFFANFFRSKNDSNLGNVAFELGKIKFIVLNTNFNVLSEDRIQLQWKWLKSELDSAQKKDLFSVLVMHHAPYSSSAEYIRPIPRRLREQMVPILESYKNVQLVLSGHLHMYERSLKDNINYLIAGPSGGIYNVLSYKNEYMKFFKQFVTTFTLIKINFPKITFETYDIDQNLVEKFSFTIKK